MIGTSVITEEVLGKEYTLRIPQCIFEDTVNRMS